MATDMMMLFVHIIGHNPQPLGLKMKSSNTVDDLKRYIIQKGLNPLEQVKPHDLTLYKVEIPDVSTLEQLVPLAHKEKLEISSCPLYMVFPMGLPPHMVNILAEAPSAQGTILGHKWLHTDLDDPVGSPSLKHFKLAITAPSVISKKDNYMLMQRQPSQRLFDDRPQSDELPPISLLFDGFGCFMDNFSHEKNISIPTKECWQLQSAVDFFAEQMTQFYKDEDERRTAGLWALNKILALGSKPSRLMEARIGDIISDGHYYGPHEGASCMVKFKNDLGDINSDPVVELASCVAHSHRRAKRINPQIFKAWRAPCLGLTIVGPYITFYGIILLHRWHIVSLTPTLSCLSSACDGYGRSYLYAAFTAALALLHQIDETAADITHSPSSYKALSDYTLPYISALPKYNASSNIQFQILHHLPGLHSHHLLYIAQVSKTEQLILLKFTHHYSIDLHSFCANHGHAPQIFGFGHLPGGWLAVAMEYIHPVVHPSESSIFSASFDKWATELQDLMQAFHNENLVHGDLREPNILCSGEKVMLIDFDWGGRVGEAYYPSASLCAELTDGRDSDDSGITKGDDERVLNNTLKRLRSKLH